MSSGGYTVTKAFKLACLEAKLTANVAKGGGAAAVHGRGRRRNAAALNQHTTYFHREGAQDVDIVGPFDAENVAQPR